MIVIKIAIKITMKISYYFFRAIWLSKTSKLLRFTGIVKGDRDLVLIGISYCSFFKERIELDEKLVMLLTRLHMGWLVGFLSGYDEIGVLGVWLLVFG